MGKESVRAYVRFVDGGETLECQRRYAYELLSLAVKETFSVDSFEVYRDDNGKPYTNDFCFSVSHTECAVAVALSLSNVGIDVERVSGRALRTLKKVGLRSGIAEYDLSDVTIATELWTKKEATFKANGGVSFRPENVRERDAHVVTDKIGFCGGVLCVSVAGEFNGVEIIVLSKGGRMIDVRTL